MIVCQLAKLKGAKVIGIAGGKEKCDVLVNEVGVDASIDYKNQNINEKIKEHAPDGIDIFFDNVGGEILDIALDNIRDRARVVICGAISQYRSLHARRRVQDQRHAALQAGRLRVPPEKEWFS